MKPEANKAFTLELADKVLRSWGLILAGLFFGLAGAVAVLHFAPKVYEAKTRMWIATQQIPEDVVRTTVKDDMSRRLLAFRDAVLDQPYMIALIEQTYGLPESEEGLRAMIDRIRQGVVVRGVESRRLGTLSFEISYRDRDPQRTTNVVNTLTRLYISQNKEFREQRATATSDVIERMAEDAKTEFDQIDARLQRFIKEHQFETEEQLEMNFRLLETRKRDVELNRTQQDTVRARIENLENLLAQARSRSTISVDVSGEETVLDPLTQRIAQAKKELDDLRIHYSERHPDYLRKKRELEDLLALARSQRGSRDATGEGEDEVSLDPQVSALSQSLGEARQELFALETAADRLDRDITEYERRIEVEPEVQRQLNVLREEHAIYQENYRKLHRDAERAKESQEIEESELAQHIEVLEYASVPTLPISPRPERVVLVTLVMGFLIFVGPMVARAALNPVISSELGLRAFAEVPVLATVPTIPNPQNRGAERRRMLKNLGWTLTSFTTLVLVVVYLA